MKTLKDEVFLTLEFLIDMDIQIYNKVSEGTLEAIKTQGYTLTSKNKLKVS